MRDVSEGNFEIIHFYGLLCLVIKDLEKRNVFYHSRGLLVISIDSWVNPLLACTSPPPISTQHTLLLQILMVE